jgi:prefoldin alpha subunit
MDNLLQKAMQMRQESEELEKQIEFVSQQITDMEQFRKNLDFIKKNKNEKILAPLGRGVFFEGEMKKQGKLLVEIGAGVFIKKSYDDTADIIETQIKKFKEFKLQLETRLQEYVAEFYEMLQEVQEMKKD